jgi:hypothetical protein
MCFRVDIHPCHFSHLRTSHQATLCALRVSCSGVMAGKTTLPTKPLTNVRVDVFKPNRNAACRYASRTVPDLIPGKPHVMDITSQHLHSCQKQPIARPINDMSINCNNDMMMNSCDHAWDKTDLDCTMLLSVNITPREPQTCYPPS